MNNSLFSDRLSSCVLELEEFELLQMMACVRIYQRMRKIWKISF